MVGTSGRTADRCLAETASARSLPSLIIGTAGGIDEKMIGVWPPTADWIAGPAPGNGTCTRSSPNVSLNSSPDRCGVVPTPAWAKLLYLPGLALIRSTSSLTFVDGTDGCTLKRFGASAATVTGAKSLYGSYGTLA